MPPPTRQTTGALARADHAKLRGPEPEAQARTQKPVLGGHSRSIWEGCDALFMEVRTDSRERVLLAYGEVMSLVQHWEQALAMVWWRAERKGPRPAGDFDTPASQKQISRLEAAFLHMTAQAVREAVSPHLEPETAESLSELMADRNRLAHRFLRERASEGGDFEAGTHDQLIAMGNRFMESWESIMRTIDSFEGYTGPVPKYWEPIAERIVGRVFSGEKVPRDPEQQ
jgi:hypothetical protein